MSEPDGVPGKSRGEARRNALVAVLAAAVGGILAIVGGVVASRMTFDQQRQLDRDRAARADTAAERVLWINYGARIDDLESIPGFPPTPECDEAVTVAGAYLHWSRLVEAFGREGNVLKADALQLAMDAYV